MSNGSFSFTDYDNERHHMENLVASRFNFLLIIFSATIASLSMPINFKIISIIFFIGSCICLLLSLTIARAHKKFLELMKITLKKNLHPASIVNDIANDSPYPFIKYSVKNLIGYFIPFILTFLLLIGSALIFCFNDTIYEKESSSKTYIIKLKNESILDKKNTDDVFIDIQDIVELYNKQNERINELENRIKLLSDESKKN